MGSWLPALNVYFSVYCHSVYISPPQIFINSCMQRRLIAVICSACMSCLFGSTQLWEQSCISAPRHACMILYINTQTEPFVCFQSRFTVFSKQMGCHQESWYWLAFRKSVRFLKCHIMSSRASGLIVECWRGWFWVSPNSFDDSAEAQTCLPLSFSLDL